MKVRIAKTVSPEDFSEDEHGFTEAVTHRPVTHERQLHEPVRLRLWSARRLDQPPIAIKQLGWVFRNKLIEVTDYEHASYDEVVTRVKHEVLSAEHEFERMKREIEVFEKFMNRPIAEHRERIPPDVRMFVWRRDEGRCTKCGSQDRLEFDHIVPIAHGGSNTARNIELLCERCNRVKGANV